MSLVCRLELVTSNQCATQSSEDAVQKHQNRSTSSGSGGVSSTFVIESHLSRQVQLQNSSQKQRHPLVSRFSCCSSSSFFFAGWWGGSLQPDAHTNTQGTYIRVKNFIQFKGRLSELKKELCILLGKGTYSSITLYYNKNPQSRKNSNYTIRESKGTRGPFVNPPCGFPLSKEIRANIQCGSY